MQVGEPCGNVSGAQGCRKKCRNCQEAVYRLLHSDGWEAENAISSALDWKSTRLDSPKRVPQRGKHSSRFRKRKLCIPDDRDQYLDLLESICILRVVLLGDFSSVGVEAREVDEAHFVRDIAQGGLDHAKTVLYASLEVNRGRF